MTRSAMIDVLRQDYIVTARAKGAGPVPGAARPRPAQRRPADHRHDRPGHRHLHERCGGGRIGVRLAGHRPADLAGDPDWSTSRSSSASPPSPPASSCSATCWPIWWHRSSIRGSGFGDVRAPVGARRRPGAWAALSSMREPRRPSNGETARRQRPGARARVGRCCRGPGRRKQGGQMVVTYKDDVTTLDPAIGYDWQNWSIIKSLFDGLMDYKPGTMDLVPDLAESYEISPDGQTYTFKVRPGVKFHNGRELTAEDIKYSIERVLDPATQSPGAGFFGSIASIDVPDPQTDRVQAVAAGRHLPARHGDQLRPRRAQGGGREVRRRFRQAPGGHRCVQAGGMDARPAARARAQSGLLEARRAQARPDRLRGRPGAAGGAAAAAARRGRHPGRRRSRRPSSWRSRTAPNGATTSSPAGSCTPAT